MRRYKKWTALLLTVVLFAGCFGKPVPVRAEENAENNVVVVIDPGHGGANLGAQPPGYLEKDMTLATAWAMKAELEKYQGVTVYMTRSEDVDLSLEQRADIAKSLGADFLFSLHYNMSANHYFYGAEVWAQGAGSNYDKGYAVGQMLLQEYSAQFNIFSRGVKAKRNSRGSDYYGVLRQSAKLGVPAVIVEHCHMDNAADAGFFNTPEKIQSLGRADATAVAKYFGLKSEALQVDYSGYPKPKAPARSSVVKQDVTPPEVAYADINSVDNQNQSMGITVHASDSDGGILYVSYSTDGGLSFSPLLMWPPGIESCTINVPAASNEGRSLIIRAFNLYDGMKESTPLTY